MAPHGGKTGYLHDPARYQEFDRELFTRLHDWLVANQTRQVSLIERSDLIPGASYYSCVVPDLPCDRERYFVEMFEALKHSQLIFFDPDNGLEVRSKTYKGKPSRRHLYFHEVKSAFEMRHSVLAIQFFPRKKRDEYIEARTQELQRHLGIRPVCLRTANVAYFLAMREAHAESLMARVQSVCLKWSGKISLAT